MFAETRQGKRITVYVCGDPFMKGKVVTLNTHEIPGLDRFCSFLTERVPDRRGGYYRRVYTPNGTEVRDLGQIEAGREYVASRDKYRKAAKDFSYSEIPEKTRPIHRKGHNNDITYTPVQHAHDERYRNKSGRSKYLVEHRRGMRLLVHINGGFEKASYPVSILYRDITNYPNIIQEIQQSMGLPQIREVYKVINQGGHRENFVLVTDASMIAQNDHLVVLPKGGAKELIPAVYSLDGKKNFKVPTSPRHGQAYDFPSFPPDNRQYKHNKSLNKHRPLPSIGSSKQSDTMSPYSNPPGSQGGRKTNRSKGRRKEVDYDKDEGGVFRSKQNNARGAHQERVDEDAAAAKIQAGVKGYNARKDYKAKKEAKNREDDNRRLDEEARRREEEALRHEEEELRQAEQDRDRGESAGKKQMDEDKAATKIQASFKGHKARKEYQAKKQQAQQ